MGTTSYPLYPRSAFLSWTRSHAPIFTARAADIGLTVDRAAEFAAAVDEAQALIEAQEAALNAYRTATTAMEAGLARLREVTGGTVRTIRAFAESAPDPQEVFSAALIQPQARPSPAAPPAQPSSLGVVLRTVDGAMQLRWKARNPKGTQGTSYIVQRKLPGESGFTFLGVTGAKRFTDASLPAGASSVQYTVQGQRGDTAGAAASITVQVGALPRGSVTKLAA